MPPTATVKPARERILDAASNVMRADGIANATTKAIAAEAGYSEAMLYKHFSDKQALYLAVLAERIPALGGETPSAGTGVLDDNVGRLVFQLSEYFSAVLPMSLSIFSSRELLADHRDGIRRHGGAGPVAPLITIATYLEEERTLGRLKENADTLSAARLLTAVAFHQAFLAHFDGRDSVSAAEQMSSAVTAIVLSGIRSIAA